MGQLKAPRRDASKANKTEISNENLLINSDFNIHQRYDSNIIGLATGFICDHWVTEFSDRNSVNKIDFTNSGMQFVLNKNTLIVHRYNFEDHELEYLDGKEVTFSFSVNDEILYHTYIFDKSKIFVIYNNAHVKDCGFVDKGDISQSIEIGAKDDTSLNVSFNWAKLELGNTATQYEKPDHTLEMLKCMRYFQIVLQRSVDFALPISQFIGNIAQWNYRSVVPMRLINPTLVNTLNVTPRIVFSDKTGTVVTPYALNPINLHVGDLNKMNYTLSGLVVDFNNTEWNIGNIDAVGATEGYLGLDAEI